MSIGQVAEIGTMAILGFCLKRLGWRTTMVIGILGHAVRFAVFALVPDVVPAIAVNLLHGICYAFFFATVYIFVDEFFPKDARASAQGLFNFLILGLGPLVGFFVWPALGEIFKSGDKIDFQSLFLVPSATALVAALLLFVVFQPPAKATVEITPPPGGDHWEPALRRVPTPAPAREDHVQSGPNPPRDTAAEGIKE
jgi:MFS family permease